MVLYVNFTFSRACVFSLKREPWKNCCNTTAAKTTPASWSQWREYHQQQLSQFGKRKGHPHLQAIKLLHKHSLSQLRHMIKIWQSGTELRRRQITLKPHSYMQRSRKGNCIFYEVLRLFLLLMFPQRAIFTRYLESFLKYWTFKNKRVI